MDGVKVLARKLEIGSEKPGDAIGLVVGRPTDFGTRWLRSATLFVWPMLLSAGLLWLCFFPVNCPWLAWFALVPFLGLTRSLGSGWRIYTSAYLGGVLFYLAVLQWLRVADWRMTFTWLGLTIYLSVYFPIAIFILRRIVRQLRVPLVVAVPVVWTALEWLRSNLFGGFAWYLLGHTQHDLLPLIQISDLAGAYGVSFMVAAVNALVLEYSSRWPRFNSFLGLSHGQPFCSHYRLIPQTIGVFLLLTLVISYGSWRLGQGTGPSGPRIALIQGNIDQRIRNAASNSEDPDKPAQQILLSYVGLSGEAAAQKPRPNLIVWPETSFPYTWTETEPGVSLERMPPGWTEADRANRRLVKEFVDLWRTNALLGLNAERLQPDGKIERYNSAILVQTDGKVAGRYDKMHRVPFGEFVPFRETIPWINRLAPYDFDYSILAGTKFTRFPLAGARFGVLICYEDTDPDLAREYVRRSADEPPVDFFVNISNDGWFDGTSEHDQHLAICRFRAIECRRAIVRSVNMGISALIDGNGRVVALPGVDWERSKKIESVLSVAVPMDQRASLYPFIGDLPWYGCWIFIGVTLSLGVMRRSTNLPSEREPRSGARPSGEL